MAANDTEDDKQMEVLLIQKRLKEAESLELEAKLAYVAQCDLVLKIRNLLTPIHQFSSAILSQIFCAYVESIQDEIPLASLLLTHVCRKWRKIGQDDTPQIWTTFFIFYKMGCSPHAEMISQYLCRSDLPIDIRIECEKWTGPGKSFLPEIAEALIPFTSRIQSLRLNGPLNRYTPLFDLPSGSFPILTNLDLKIGVDATCQWSVNRKISAFDKSPLRTLGFRCLSMPPQRCSGSQDGSGGLRSFSLDTRQLTTMRHDDRYNLRHDNSWNMLQQGFESLVHCTISFQELPSREPYNLVPIDLPNLTELTIFCPYEQILVKHQVFSLLTTPSLTDLSVNCSETPSTRRAAIAAPLIEFQRRCGCSLNNLSFIGLDSLTEKDMTSIIDAFGFSIQSLTYLGRKIPPSQFLQTLMGKTNKRGRLPHLESLRFGLFKRSTPSLPPALAHMAELFTHTYSDDDTLSASLLLDVVESRWFFEQMERCRIQIRLKKVQLDNLVAKDEIISIVSSTSNPAPEVATDQHRETWLASMSADDRGRLERLRSEGCEIQLLESDFPVFFSGRGLREPHFDDN